PEAIAYECSYDEFEKASILYDDIETVYAFACRGVFKSSLITQKYYDRDVGKYYKIIQGKLIYIDENYISTKIERQLEEQLI
ncbi:MAG: hypothetical protein KAS12_03580, partial [Candidatus Aenigmarchaeota archaeon]|nr:hypothetical protein [Candidatus Aenigmarchaeota archaeon]